MWAALRRSYRAEPVLTVCTLLVALATVAPFWVGRYLPLLDLPNHLSAITVWHRYHDPDWDFSKYYTLNLQPLPYWAHYYFCHQVGRLVGVEVANKIYLTGYALAFPAGVAALARRFGRSPWLALFAFPVVWNMNLAEGFVAFCGGMAALVWGLYLVDIHAERPRWSTGFLVAVTGIGLYTFHLLAYAGFLLAAGLLCFGQRQPLDWKRLLQRGVPVVSGSAIGIWTYLHQVEYGFQKLEGKRYLVEDVLAGKLSMMPLRFLDFLANSRDEWVVVVLIAAWLMLALTRARARTDEEVAPTGPRAWGLELCLAGILALFLLLPRTMQRPFYWYMINQRYVPLIFVLAVLTLRGPIVGARRWLLAPVIAAALFYAGDIGRAIVGFNHRVDGFDQVVAQIPWHKSTLTLSLRPLGDPEFNVNPYNQWPSYTQMRRGGYNFYNFNQGFPLKYRGMKPAPAWDHAELFNYEWHGGAWDYFLTHNESTSVMTPGHVGEGLPQVDLFSELISDGKVRLVASSGPWRLYENLVPEMR